LLTADAYGVMPPIAKLTPAQAMYHFLSGYTAKVAGTEKGLVGVQPEFSTCFGAPFLPRHPSVYGNLLRELIAAHGVDCWLVNTGWTAGRYGVGRRMPIKVTRTLLTAALNGSLRNAKFRTDPYFGFSVPTQLAGVEPHLLYPHKTWQNKAEFDDTARSLVAMFQNNFVQFENHVDADVRAAAPEVEIAAAHCRGVVPQPATLLRQRQGQGRSLPSPASQLRWGAYGKAQPPISQLSPRANICRCDLPSWERTAALPSRNLTPTSRSSSRFRC